LQFGRESDIIKDLVLFNDGFHVTGGEAVLRVIMQKVWNAYNFEIEL